VGERAEETNAARAAAAARYNIPILPTNVPIDQTRRRVPMP